MGRGDHNNNNGVARSLSIVLPPGIHVIHALGLHCTVSQLGQVFVDVGNADKLTLLVDLLASE